MATPEEPQPRVLVAYQEPHASRESTGTDLARIWTGLVGVGAALAVVGWTDVALLWWPPRFGDAQWEFVIITNFFDALPVATVGTTLVALGVVEKYRRWLTNLAILAVALMVVALVAATAVYLLDVPVALKSTPAAARSALYRSLLKTGAFATTYTVFYTWLAWFLSRRTKPART